jgi:hypothetical protein
LIHRIRNKAGLRFEIMIIPLIPSKKVVATTTRIEVPPSSMIATFRA